MSLKWLMNKITFPVAHYICWINKCEILFNVWQSGSGQLNYLSANVFVFSTNFVEHITFSLKPQPLSFLCNIFSVKVGNYLEVFRSQWTLKLSLLCSRTLPLDDKNQGHIFNTYRTEYARFFFTSKYCITCNVSKIHALMGPNM